MKYTNIYEKDGSKAILEGVVWDAIVAYMDDDIREHVHNEIAPCSNKDFLLSYLNLDPDFVTVLESEFNLDVY